MLSYVYLPTNISSLTFSCFKDCVKLKQVHIPKGCTLTIIYQRVFFNTKIEELYIPPFLTSIGLLSLCNNKLKRIIIDPNNSCFKFVNNTLYGDRENSVIWYIKTKKAIKTFTPAFKVHNFRDYCFYGAKNIEEIIVPDGVVSLFEKCIANTNVVRIVLPRTVTFIGTGCFANNTKLIYIRR